jgi:putative glutamine amidotransferase
MRSVDMRGYPRIGVSVNVDADRTSVQNINENYVAAIYDARGIPLVVPVPGIQLGKSYTALAQRVVEGLSGLLLTGGDDIDAARYGEENLCFNGGFVEERDLFEVELCKAAVGQKKPILGICRGAQLLNVAMGGTLYQDITRQHPGKTLLTHAQATPSHTGVHGVELTPGSQLAEILLPPETTGWRIRVNSFHHQSVKDAAPGFLIVATASDGIAEAIEPRGGGFAGHPFSLGVQWHPERMYKHHESAQRLFLKFVEACAKELFIESAD